MAPSASESNLRSSISQFRWARGVTDDSQAPSAGNSRNPFSRFYNAVGGAYVPLRSSETSNEEEAYFALSRWERCGLRVLSPTVSSPYRPTVCRRFLGFIGCLVGAAVCFGVAFLTLPLLAIRPAKFALAFRYACTDDSASFTVDVPPSLGSLLVMFG